MGSYGVICKNRKRHMNICREVCIASCIFLTGCATQPRTPIATPVAVPARLNPEDMEPAKCITPRECEIMWAEASSTLELVSNMRVRISTDNRIETFPPMKYSQVGGIVTKRPVGNTGYEVSLRLECYRFDDCKGIQTSGTTLFNLHLKSIPRLTTP